MEIIIILILLGIFLTLVIYGSVFFMIGMAYGYWGLSIGMAPIVWIILGIGLIVGFAIAVKNAVKALKMVYGKENQE